MRWLKESYCFQKHIKYTSFMTKLDSSWHHTADKNCYGIRDAEMIVNHASSEKRPQSGVISPLAFQQFGIGSGRGGLRFYERRILANNEFKGFGLSSCGRSSLTMFRQFGKMGQKGAFLSRDWLVQLWLSERRLEISRLKRMGRVVRHVHNVEAVSESQPSFYSTFRTWFESHPMTEERPNEQEMPLIKQPPPSQSDAAFLQPTSPEEVRLEPLLARSNLIITRHIEWANLMLGFEQENRYAIMDVCYPQYPVGFILERSNVIFRQLLRTRRPFVANITDGMGNELFRVRRPAWLINSTIYAEIDGKEIGVVHRRWHLWRRIYDLYLGKKQFAVVENPGFWNWTFTLTDADGNVLAEIDRNWRGVGFELLTDAGQYVIRFGHSDPRSKVGPARAVQELEISRPLTLSERAVAVALAVSLDNDYFSRHGGWGLPFIAVGE